ncbi:SLC13 family permease [Saccharopolyspora flava]|uniref:Transporter, UIT1 family (TC 9.B.48) n=1 Tax=Saccharopolyspora flava TaxID=95161 RepID=A0A1I6UIH3_9PSEU|nr:SLC13 family permease [Saccharopolyspora flava]SFT01255.1 transporter, UIT1 family (TC 9.B.48) [Saccharopolyspora flava]
MSAELISILALVAIFVITGVFSVNMGALAFAAAFLVGTLAGGMSSDDILGGFPGDIFMVLVGVTYLFAIARANGTIDWLVYRAVRLVGGRLMLVPWVMLAVSALLTAIGAVPPAAVAIIAPVAMGLAAKHGISPLLMSVMVVHGTMVGGFSPISVFGVIVNGVVDRNGLDGSPLFLFFASFALNLVFAAAAFALLGRRRKAETPVPADVPGAARDDALLARVELSRDKVLTLVGILTMVVLTLFLELDIGLVAITVAVVLGIISPQAHRDAVKNVTWPTVLLICGVLTYVSVLQELGTVDYVSHAVSSIGIPLLSAFLLCLIGAVVSAFASSTGLLGALIPLAVPLMAAGQVGVAGMVAALAIASTVVDISPFSTSGAIMLANSREDERDRVFKGLTLYGGTMVVLAPIVVWLTMIAPGIP